jgi:hypothetical protein
MAGMRAHEVRASQGAVVEEYQDRTGTQPSAAIPGSGEPESLIFLKVVLQAQPVPEGIHDAGRGIP